MPLEGLADKLKTDKLPARLRSPRALIGLVIAIVALAGGYYFFTSAGPKPAFASNIPRQVSRRESTTRMATNNHSEKSARPGVKTTVSRLHGKPAVEAANQSASIAAAQPAPVRVEAAPDPLGPVYVDEANGFNIRFPAGWALRTFNGEPWILDCGDIHAGLISVGFSPCPPNYRADRLLPETIARRIRRRPNTILHAQGRTLIDGHQSIWSKSTGPLPTTTGAPRMTQVQYIVPLTDGRVLELRVASPPDQFNDLASLFSKSLTTFHLDQRESGK